MEDRLSNYVLDLVEVYLVLVFAHNALIIGAMHQISEELSLPGQERMADVLGGGVTETSFNPTAKFETAYIERKDAEYSYSDGDLFYFMDQETFDMVPVSKSDLPDGFAFVKENTVCKLMIYKEKVVGVEAPNFVELEITETDPGFKGDTATNVTKPATVETGAEIKVPLFINPGDKIKIDTRTGEHRTERS